MLTMQQSVGDQFASLPIYLSTSTMYTVYAQPVEQCVRFACPVVVRLSCFNIVLGSRYARSIVVG